MSKIVNKLQLSKSLQNSYNIAKANGYYSNSTKGNALNQVSASSRSTIESECNKPLRSKCYVSTHNKLRKDWTYNQSNSFGVYRSKGNYNLWLCRDRQTRPELSDCEREQIRLYRQLKREYEREQKLLRGDVSSDTTVTRQEKLQAKVRQQAIKLLNGLACSPNYDRIYSVG